MECGIEKELCSMSYVLIDQVVDCILNFESGALMAKIDIKQAYRNIPVHPDDRHLLAMQWRNEVLIDKVLPFGLRSAPLIFSAVVDALQWIIERKGAHGSAVVSLPGRLHYRASRVGALPNEQSKVCVQIQGFPQKKGNAKGQLHVSFSWAWSSTQLQKSFASRMTN